MVRERKKNILKLYEVIFFTITKTENRLEVTFKVVSLRNIKP